MMKIKIECTTCVVKKKNSNISTVKVNGWYTVQHNSRTRRYCSADCLIKGVS